MKKIYILISVVLFSIIIINILYYRDIYRQQLFFQKDLISKQVQICGAEIEKTGYNFESDINFIPFTNNLSSIFQDDLSSGLQRIKLFYIRYEDLIENIKIFDNDNNVYSIYKDNKGNFITDHYISQRQRVLLAKETLFTEKDQYYYSVPYFNQSDIKGNIQVKLKFVEYFNDIFSQYHLGKSLWQWLIDSEGNIISQNLTQRDTIEISQKDLITGRLVQGLEGFTKHKVIVNGMEDEVISAFYPVRILQQNFGIVFSLRTDVILRIIIRKTLIISTFSFILLLFTIFFFLRIVKEKEKKINQLSGQFDDLNNIIESLPIGVVIVNEDKTIRQINKTASDLFFLETDDTLIGKNITERFLIPGESESNDNVFESAQFIYYEKDDAEVVLYKKEVPMQMKGQKLTLEAFFDVSPLEKSRKQEVAANNAKSDFLAKMSHEIRTPMNGIIGMTDALMRQELNDQQKDFIKIIKKSADLLLAIINDILDFSKIEAGKMQLEELPFSLQDEMNLTLDLFRPIAEEKNIAINTKIADNTHNNLIGDPFRLRQVITNLVGNAIKFTHEGQILITVTQVEEYSGNLTLMFSVEDTGIGIPKNKIGTIFNSFTQADDGTSRKYGGTGLGTTICKQLVDLMNGEIWVESPSSISTDKKYPGSKFSFTMEAFSNEKLDKNLNYDGIEHYQDINILLINKNGIYEENAVKPFDGLGINIYCRSQEDAFEEFNKARENNTTTDYQIVIIRDNITFDGFETLRTFYNNKTVNNHIFAIFSSNDKQGNYVKCKRFGADYYVVKPYNASEALNIIKDNFKGIIDQSIQEIRKIPENLSILVAEDNIINQKVAQTIFNNLGYTIDLARDGMEVMDKMKQHKYDIVFLDLIMPEKDGLQTTIEIRGMGYDLPIVAMTASNSKESKTKAISVGMNEYLVKPVSVESVKDILIRWFSEN
jgi:signal transduction histidine kinase/CheY-like chemotaxis protein